jgi:hypothetical protein
MLYLVFQACFEREVGSEGWSSEGLREERKMKRQEEGEGGKEGGRGGREREGGDLAKY